MSNFVGPDTGAVFHEDVLRELISNEGIATEEFIRYAGMRWEEANSMAAVFPWETPESSTYLTRKRAIPRAAFRPLEMDPALAQEEIDRLMRAANPKDHEPQINALRAVLNEAPLNLPEYHIAPPVVTDAPPDPNADPSADPEGEKTVDVADPNSLEARKQRFAELRWQDQAMAITSETDFAVAEWVSETKEFLPVVRSAAKLRADRLRPEPEPVEKRPVGRPRKNP